ncbi:MAG: Hsp70 family protein [Cetobacterium sp.]
MKIGIDLGTTNSLVGIEHKGKIKTLKFAGSDSLKSVLFYKEGEVEIGKKAAKKGMIYPRNRIKSSKTYMGDFNKKWNIEGKEFNPTDVATEILKEIRTKVIEKMKLDSKEEIEVVITVPAYFTSNQIDETKKAGERANLKIKRIITEPVAAAIAYGMEMGENEKLFIVDLGGGTFDVTILEARVSDGEYDTISIDGDKKLGGDDFDEILVNLFIEKIKKDTGLDFSKIETSGTKNEHDYEVILATLTEEAELLKIELSESQQKKVNIPNLFSYNGKDYHFEIAITRDEFKTASRELLEKIEESILRCLKNKGIKPKDIDRVVLVGGSCHLPFMYEMAKDIFGKEPYSNLDLGTLVVTGATIVALSGESLQNKIKIMDNISHSLGIEILGETGKYEFEPLLNRGEKYPISAEKIFTTAYDFQEKVSLNIYEGETIEKCEVNEFYGGFILDNIEKAKSGIPQIKVKFDFDESRILTVTAEDMNTGSKKIVVVKKEIIEKKINNKPIDFVLLVDTSGSMRGRPIEEAKNGCKALVNEVLDLNVHRLGIIGFGDEAVILNNLISDKKELNDSINKLTVYGGTNMNKAIALASNMIQHTKNEKVIIIVTDGAPNNRSAALSEAENTKMLGVKLIAIGAGEDVDSIYLRELTTTPKDYYFISDIKKLEETFETIVSSLKNKK